MKDTVKIKTYKGIDIYYHLNDGHLSATNKETDEHFTGKYIFEIEQAIDEPYWEEYTAKGFYKSGYFEKELQRVESVRRDRKSKKCQWKVVESTDSQYDVGKVLDDWRKVKVYPWSEEREKIYKAVLELQESIAGLERAQQDLIRKL